MVVMRVTVAALLFARAALAFQPRVRFALRRAVPAMLEVAHEARVVQRLELHLLHLLLLLPAAGLQGVRAPRHGLQLPVLY